MKIKMLKTMAGPGFSARVKGTVIDLPFKEAKPLLEGNIAEPVDTAKDENTQAAPPEKAMDRRPHSKAKRPPRRSRSK